MAVYDDEKTKTDDLEDAYRGSLDTDDIERGIAEAENYANQEATDSEASQAERSSLTNKLGDEGSGALSENPTKKNRLRLSRKQTASFGSIGLIIGAFAALMNILSGPLQHLKLDFSLGRFNRSQSLVADARTRGFLRTARLYRSGDIGESRVGFLGSRSFHNILNRLESQHGIDFPDRRVTSGRATRIRITPPEGSPLRGATPDETHSNILRHLDLPDNDRALHRVGATFTGDTFIMNTQNVDSGQLRRLAGSLVALDNQSANKTRGRTILAMRKRIFTKFWNAPSLFHPMSRTGAWAQERYDTRQARKARERERKNRTGKRAQLATKYQNAKTRLRNRVGSTNLTVASGALTFTGGLCLLKEISDILPGANYGFIVAPSKEEAVDKQAVSSQMKANNDFNSDQLAAVTETFEDDEGGTIWSSKPLNALSDGGKGAGTDIKPEHKQAFTMRGGSIEGLVKTMIDEDPELKTALQTASTGGDSFAGIACSTPGYALQIAAGAALTWFVPGGAFAKTAQFAGSTVVIAGIMNFVGGLVEGRVGDAARGICGYDEEGDVEDATELGSCMAYGARAMSNANGASMGAIELSNSDEVALLNELDEQELAEFRQKDLLTRLFGLKEQRSLAANLLHSAPHNPKQTIHNVASNILQVPYSSASNVASIFSADAQAEPVSYDWGFPLMAVPLNIIESAEFEDPFENAQKAAAIFNRGDDEIERAEICFGVKIEKVNGLWQAEPVREVVPQEEEYVQANCNGSFAQQATASTDISTSELSLAAGDEDWIRTMLFVLDDAIVTAIDCREGGSNSCQELGISSGSSSSSTPPRAGDIEIQKYHSPLPPSTSGAKITPKGITLHWWGGSGGGNIDSLASTLRGRGLSVQFGITQDGRIYQMMENEDDLAAHATGGNQTTFGIEIEGPPAEFGQQGIENFPEKFEAVVSLVQYLVDKYNINTGTVTAECGNVIGIHPHKSYNHCPKAKGKVDIDDVYFNAVMERIR